MSSLDPSLLLTQTLPAVILFLILFVVLKTVLFSPALKLIHDQESKLDNVLKRADSAEKEAADVREKVQAAWTEARTRIQAGREQRLIDAGHKAEATIEGARTEVKRLVDEAQSRAMREADVVRKELSGQVASWSQRLAEKLIHP